MSASAPKPMGEIAGPKAATEPFPWSQVMAFGLGVLRLPPCAFWAMTPRELAAAMGRVEASPKPSTRSWLDQAQLRYPDNETPSETKEHG